MAGYALVFAVPGLVVAWAAMTGLTRVWPWYRQLRALAKVGVLLGALAAPLLLIRVVGLLYLAVLRP